MRRKRLYGTRTEKGVDKEGNAKTYVVFDAVICVSYEEVDGVLYLGLSFWGQRPKSRACDQKKLQSIADGRFVNAPLRFRTSGVLPDLQHVLYYYFSQGTDLLWRLESEVPHQPSRFSATAVANLVLSHEMATVTTDIRWRGLTPVKAPIECRGWWDSIPWHWVKPRNEELTEISSKS